MRRLALVTGATGFVGRRLVDRLRRDGWRVRVAARDPRTVEGDAFAWAAPDPPDVGAFAGVDTVLHLAAHIPSDYTDPGAAARCLEVNALGTLNLLLAASDAGVTHAVTVSSGNVYSPTDRATEDSPAYPSARASYYLASKLCGEIWASHLSESGRIGVGVLRPSAIYGPGMKGGAVALFADRLASAQPVVLQDGGRYCVDLVFVDDVVDAIVRAAERRAAGRFNVGSGRVTSMRSLVDALVDVTGADPSLVQVVPPGSGPGGGFPALDISRARATLGYEPTPLLDGLRRMVS